MTFCEDKARCQLRWRTLPLLVQTTLTPAMSLSKALGGEALQSKSERV